MNNELHIPRREEISGTAGSLPASKSISNRVLIINALGGGRSVIHNLSDANDTQLMIRLIDSAEKEIDAEDAGTTMRFLTGYFAVSNQLKILTGTERMQERPIGILVNALRSLGATIRYTNKEGFPPLQLEGFEGQKTDSITMRGDVSSQYISSLMMIAPLLPKGLTIELSGKIGSRPYIEMTMALMQHFGADCSFSGNLITVRPQPYKPGELFVESDWSAASYWFAFTALASSADISLPHLSLNSMQGDHVIAAIMKKLGVHSIMEEGLLRLSKAAPEKEVRWDFTHCPDLAQTVAVVCAAKGITGHFTGLESLRIKETDRVSALQQELEKIGASLQENSDGWTLKPAVSLPDKASFCTYKDHRMAMAFAPLATKMDVTIENPGVVKKSYPAFWSDMQSVGFEIRG